MFLRFSKNCNIKFILIHSVFILESEAPLWTILSISQKLTYKVTKVSICLPCIIQNVTADVTSVIFWRLSKEYIFAKKIYKLQNIFLEFWNILTLTVFSSPYIRIIFVSYYRISFYFPSVRHSVYLIIFACKRLYSF